MFVATALTWGEYIHAQAARRSARLSTPAPGSSGVVVVLGFGNRGTRANQVNRWRARIAVRTARRAEQAGAIATIVCCGGAVRGHVPEALLLRRHVVETLGWRGSVVVEPESSSTWENVRNVLPLITEAEWIALASNGLHAEKARVYLGRQGPDLVDRIVAADDYRAAEQIWLKPLFAAVGIVKLRAVFHVEHWRC